MSGLLCRYAAVAALLLSSVGACSSSEPDAPAAPAATSPSGSRDDATGSRGDAGSRDDASPAPAPAPRPPGPLFRAEAARGELAAFTLDEATLAPDGTVTIRAGGGHPATDPQPTGYHGGSFYNGGSYHYAVATSPVFAPPSAFDSVTPSFEVTTPPGTWVHVKVAARVGGEWTKDYSAGVWASDTGTVRRHSVGGQADAQGDVATDTLDLVHAADALRVTVVLFSESDATPTLRAVSAVTSLRGSVPKSLASDESVWGTVLDVPKRSQMIYPGGGEVWCSPTSTSMLLAYWATELSAPGLVETPPEAADRCYDVVYDGTGNWPFNTAHAASMADGRLHAMVTRLSSFSEIERLIGAGVPVAISIAYDPGDLSGSPISSTAGHLIVVRGFSKTGDVVCNDPAFPSDAEVRVTYDREELTRAWRRSMGTTYVLWPKEKALPVDPLAAFH